MMPRRYVLAAFPQIMTDCSDFGERTCRCEVWDYRCRGTARITDDG